MKQKIAIFSILFNAVLTVAKIWVGFLSNSAAVLSDGFHSLSDIFSSFIGYFGIKISEKPVDKKHPYGHYKFEVLGGAIITLILFLTGVGVIYEAYQNFIDPKEIKIDYLVFGVMIFSALINYLTSKIKIYYGKKENSLTLISDGTHDKADVLSSLGILIGLYFSRYYIHIDSILALLVGIYIIKESFSLGKEAIDSLLDVSAGEKIEDEIKTIANKENIEIFELKTQKKGSAVTANLGISLSEKLSVGEATKISDNLRKSLLEEIESLKYVIISIKSHDVQNSYFRPAKLLTEFEFGHGFAWQGKAKFKDDFNEAGGRGHGGLCKCPKCGHSQGHEKGKPCLKIKCPKCGVNLERK